MWIICYLLNKTTDGAWNDRILTGWLDDCVCACLTGMWENLQSLIVFYYVLLWLHRYYLNWTELDDAITKLNNEMPWLDFMLRFLAAALIWLLWLWVKHDLGSWMFRRIWEWAWHPQLHLKCGRMMETLVISVLFKNRIMSYTSGLIPLTELLIKMFLVEDFFIYICQC